MSMEMAFAMMLMNMKMNAFTTHAPQYIQAQIQKHKSNGTF